MTETQSYEDWIKQAQALNQVETRTQEPQVTETTEELPAVSKLREAFETARNAIVDGSELAKQVETLSQSVDSLQSKVASLTRDLEYVHNRNRELDEQVVQVRRSRDEAIADASEQRTRAAVAERDRDSAHELLARFERQTIEAQERYNIACKERDDAMVMALEYETKFKAVDAQLNKLKVLFGEAFGEPKSEEPVKPVPHYLVQPRDEETKQFRSFDPNAGSQGSY